MKQNEEFKIKWDAMTPMQRLAVILQDPSMNHPKWKDLATRWSNSTWDKMTSLQQDATKDLLT